MARHLPPLTAAGCGAHGAMAAGHAAPGTIARAVFGEPAPLPPQELPPGAAPWPDWLRRPPCLLDDALLATAWEHSPATHRSALKQGMALHHALWGEGAARARQLREDANHGFAFLAEARPAQWALCVAAADYAAPARLVAALMPALLAGVRHVAFASVGETGKGIPAPPTAPLCLALELLGLDDLFCITPDQARSLVQALPAPRGGRLILLHTHDAGNIFAWLREIAHARGVACVEEAAAPRLALHSPEAVDAPLLRWAHGDAPIVRTGQTEHAPPPGADAVATGILAVDAVYGAPPELEGAAPLTLGHGMEGCWLDTRLTPDFFRSLRHGCHCLPPDEDAP